MGRGGGGRPCLARPGVAVVHKQFHELLMLVVVGEEIAPMLLRPRRQWAQLSVVRARLQRLRALQTVVRARLVRARVLRAWADLSVGLAGGSLRTALEPRSEHVYPFIFRGECSYSCADSVRRFTVGRVLVLNDPPAEPPLTLRPASARPPK